MKAPFVQRARLALALLVVAPVVVLAVAMAAVVAPLWVLIEGGSDAVR